jgi:hypothetical protein
MQPLYMYLGFTPRGIRRVFEKVDHCLFHLRTVSHKILPCELPMLSKCILTGQRG